MILDPIIEYNKIAKWSAKLVNQFITPAQLVKSMHKFLNQSHPSKTTLEQSTSLDRKDFAIGAAFDANYDEANKKSLIFILVVNRPPNEKWRMKPWRIAQLNIDLLEAIVHEYQHMHQYRSRDHIVNRTYQSLSKTTMEPHHIYLGNPDEIDAYAANIAARLYINKSVIHPDNSADLASYYTAFGANHPVTRLLLKKIVLHINYLENNNNDNTNRK